MRCCLIILLLFVTSCVFAQATTTENVNVQNFMYLSSHQPDLAILQDLPDSKIVSVRTTNEFFNKSYLINKKGEALSNSYMSSSNFMPNDNLIVVSGQNIEQRDSFNPYGAYDMTSMIVLSTFNTFLSRIKINRR